MVAGCGDLLPEEADPATQCMPRPYANLIYANLSPELTHLAGHLASAQLVSGADHGLCKDH